MLRLPFSIHSFCTDDPTTSTAKSPLTKNDAVSTVPTMVRGDWVLFHPVYSPEELRAVQVTLLRNYMIVSDISCLGFTS